MKENVVAQQIAGVLPTTVLAQILSKFGERGNRDAHTEIVRALGKRTEDEESGRALLACCLVDSTLVYALAGMKVLEMEIAEAMMGISCSESKDEDLRVIAINAFASRKHPEVLSKLLYLSNHSSPRICRVALSHLCRWDDHCVTPVFIVALSRDIHNQSSSGGEVYNRQFAAEILKRLPGQHVTKALLENERREGVDQVRREIVGALIGRDEACVLPVVLSCVEKMILPMKYWLDPSLIIKDDFATRKKWGKFSREKAIRMVTNICPTKGYALMPT